MKENRLPDNQKTGFRIPEDYLQDLEERLMARVIPSGMETGPRDKSSNPFEVPTGYFENLEDSLLQKVEAQQEKKPKVRSLLSRELYYYIAGVAAVLLAIVTNFSVQQQEPQSLEGLDLLSLESYLEESIDYTDPEISNLFTVDSFNFATSAQSPYIDQEALMEYLHENIEEPYLIFNDN